MAVLSGLNRVQYNQPYEDTPANGCVSKALKRVRDPDLSAVVISDVHLVAKP
jgi:hypothetical protein